MRSAPDLPDFGRRLLELLDGARKALTFYPPDHPLVAEGFKSLEYLLGDLFLTTDQVTLAVIDHEFYLNELPLKREGTPFGKLARFLEAREATSIQMLPDVRADDLRRTFVALNATPEELAARGGARAIVDGLALRDVRVAKAVPYATTGEPSAEPETHDLPADLKARLAEARKGYESALTGMKSVFETVASDGHVDYRMIKVTTEALIDSVVTNRQVWAHLLNVKHTDEYTFNHSVNVTTLSLLLATRFGVPADALSVLGEAALLHDLGKQKVPRDILQKAGALTDEEWVEMRSHPEKGAKILLGIRDVSEAAVMVAYEHHVRYDYKGYPRTRGRRDLHLFSHLVAVADIYDALTSDRGYRKALMPDMAMRIILTQSGTAFHPLVVRHFVNLVGLYPVGTFVKLATGEVGLIQYNQSRDLMRPVVLVVYDEKGAPRQPETRDLADAPPDVPPIDGCIDPAALGLDMAKL